jgi:RNA polymerase sigma-70 factor, ECF subfamily
MNDQRKDEETIIRQCLDGNTNVYTVLVDRYKTMAYNVAVRMLGDGDAAKDASQESFIAAFERLRQFKFGAKFSSWLYTIVLNKCRDHLRSTKKSISTEDLEDLRTDTGTSPEQYAVEHQRKDRLQRALDALPAEYREVLVLKHIEELDYQEIAEITGMGISALKVRAHRGREMLRKKLEDTGVVYEKRA